MKKILFVSIVLSVLAVSCIEDSRNNFMVEDALSLVYDEPVVPVSVYAGSCTISVLKSGKGTTPASATLGVSTEALDAYNAENSTSYTPISSSSYSFASSSITIKAEEMTGKVQIEWDPKTLQPALNGGLSVIPVVITDASLDINQKRNLVLVNVLNSEVGLASSGSTAVASEDPLEDLEIQIKVALDFPLPEDLNVNFDVDPSLIAAYAAEKGLDAIAPFAGYVRFPDKVVSIPAKSSDIFFTLTLKNSVLFDSNGKMKNFNTIVAPIKITGASISGVSISDRVYYMVVKSPFSGASVSRIWGKYSSTHLWSEDYGLPSGADRTMTLDADWVYLPYSVGGDVAKITAISVGDPETTKLVNCTGFKSNTITTACVRVIDKGDGTTMLTASGANGDSFAFYSWEDGIDNAPKCTELQCTWRRGGDRYEIHGTWADGTLYAHSYQGTFSTRYEIKNGQFTKTDRTLVDVPFTGFGGIYKHPDYDQMIFASADTSAFVTALSTTHKAGDGQDIHDMQYEKYPGGRLTFGYRPFTFKGDKFIAFTTMDKTEAGQPDVLRARLVIVSDKGGFKASLEADNMDIVYQAPLQGEDFESEAFEAPSVMQGDCAVCVLSNKVLIAASFQGIGLSVFKME